MRIHTENRTSRKPALIALVSIALAAPAGWAQQPYPQQPGAQYPPQGAAPPQGQYPPNAPPPAYPQGAQAPVFTPAQLDQIVSTIALYPDPLLAQIMAAATYPDQIGPANQWADQHHYLTGQALASAINSDQLPWDPSVQALLPFPSVLSTMASYMTWTTDLGNAFLSNEQAVMDAVQRARQQAQTYGYLRTNGNIVVSGGPYITIMPTNPGYIPVPYYDPRVVYFPPRRGIVVGGAIQFGFGITLGTYFSPWGWGHNSFDWGRHAVIINNAPWGRTWGNRATYVHPYTVKRYAPAAVRPAERHEVHGRDERERAAPQRGQRPVENHREEHK